MTASLPEPYETSPSDSEGTAASVEPSGPVSPPTPRAPRKTPARPKASSAAASAGSNEGPDAASPTDPSASDSAAPAKPAAKPRAPRAPRTTAAGATPRTTAARKPAAPRKPAARTAASNATTDSDTPRTPAASSASTAAKKPAAKRPAAKKPATPRTTAAAEAAAAKKLAEAEAAAATPVSPGPPPPLPDDLVVPPRPPLPGAVSASDSAVGDAEQTSAVESAPAVADATPADVAVEEPAVAAETTPADVADEDPAVAADETPADVAVEGPAVVADETPADVAVEEPAVAANETPADVAAGEPAVAADTTPADVPAGEPAVAAPIAVDPTSAGIAADEPAAEAVADPTPADVAVEEPIVDPSQADASDAVVVDETAAQPVADTTVEDPAAEPEILVATPLEDETDSAVAEPVDVAESEDPTPADVRVDGEAPVSGGAVDAESVPAEQATDDAHDSAITTAVLEPADDTRTVLITPASVDDSAAAHPDDEQRDFTDPESRDAPVDRDDATAVLAAATAESANDDSAVVVTDTDASDVAASATDDPAVAVIDADDTVVAASATTGADPETAVPALTLRNVSKSFGELKAVDAIDLTVPAGSFYGLVGPNGAGKTTTLSIIAGLLRPDGGAVSINGVDATKRSREAKKLIGVLPDRLRTFDRLTGRQLLSYYGALRGLPAPLVESRTADLARAFDLVDALARPVSDYSAGMTKKVMLAGAMIHSPRLLVLDEPFEAVDPVSSGVILDILGAYVEHGGTVILSSHGMELVERVCSRVAVIVSGQVLAEGTVDEVRGEGTLEQRFRELSGGLGDVEGLEWLHTFSA